MTTRRHTPEEIAEVFVDIRSREEMYADKYAKDSTATLIDQVMNYTLAARDSITTTESPEPTAREVLELLLEGKGPANWIVGISSPTARRWAMAFRELGLRIGSVASDDDAFRLTINNTPIRPNTIPEGMTEEDFRAAANTALKNLIANPSEAIQQDGSTE